MATIIYLDVDDEITSAAARIRGASETKVALVLPAGSRLATSRINFRLLAREALERNRVLSIVATDPAARAIAASAGLPVHATVGEFEAATAPPPSPAPAQPTEAPAAEAVATGTEPPAKRSRRRSGVAAVAGATVAGAAAGAGATGAVGAAGSAGAAGAGAAGAASASSRGSAEQLSAELVAPSDSTPTRVAPAIPPAAAQASPAPTETRARSGAATIPVMPATRTRPGLPGGLVAGLFAALVAVLILAVAGYLVLPQASVVVTPVAVPVGPVDFTVRADPDATLVDPVGGVIPATRLSREFQASGEFPATGKRTVQTKAKGNVTFRNCDTGGGHTIPAGSVVSTANGIGFATSQTIRVATAPISPAPCTEASVGVTAVKAGPNGNVAGGAINQVPPGFNEQILFVTNPQRTSGGKREEFTRVQQKDIDAAMASLTGDLNAQFDAWTAAPDDLPAGATVFPATGQIGSAVPSVDPATLIDDEEATFQLAATATGTVVAVDPSRVDQVAAERISANVPADYALQDGSIKSSHDGGQADGDLIDFRVSATGAAIPVLDAVALRDEIKGKSVAEARAFLERYGTVTINTWPGFVSSIPSLDFRLDLSIAGATDVLDPTRPSPSPSAAPSGSAP